MKTKFKIGLAALLLCGAVNVYPADVEDVIKQVKRGKFESAIKTRAKVSKKISSSQDHLLLDLADCILYNSPKYKGYNPKTAYSIYNKIAYSDYLYDKKVMNVLREEGIDIDELRLNVEANLLSDAREANSLEAIEDIIKICQGCSYLSDAQKMKEDFIFSKTLKNASVQDVEKFLADYPKSPKRAEAIKLRDSLAFVALDKNAGAYSQYISMYPESRFVPQLQKGLEDMAYEEAKASGSVNQYAIFIANYPENSRAVREFEEKIAENQKLLTWKLSPKYRSLRLEVDSASNRNYFMINDAGGWGVVTENGVQVIAPEYEDVGKVFSGLLVAKKFGKWGLVDIKSGKEALPFVVSNKDDFMPMSKLFVAYKENGKWGLLYAGSAVAVEPFVETALTEFNSKVLSNGSVALSYTGRLVIVDVEGNKVLDEQYDEVKWRNADDIDSKLIKMRVGKKWGLISSEGKVLIAPEFDMAPFFDPDGISSVKNFQREGWIDTTGSYLYYDWLSSFRDCGGDDKMISYEKNGMFGFIDKTRANNLPVVYQEVGECFQNGIAKVKKDGVWIYINRQGKVVYSMVAGASVKRAGDLLVVKENGAFKLVDFNGTVVALGEFDDVDDEMFEGMIRVRKGALWGAIDRNGSVIVPVEYEEMSRFCNNYSVVKKEGKYGLLYKTSLVLPAKYDRLLDPGHFFDDDCYAFKNGVTSNVVYVTVFSGTANEKIVMKDGKTIFKTADEIRLKKLKNGYTVIEVAELGIFTKAKVGLIGLKGELLVTPFYSQIKPMKQTGKDVYFAYSSANGKQGMIDSKGKELTPAFANSIVSFDGKLAKGEVNGDNTCFSKEGILLLPKGYDIVSENIVKNKANGKYGVINDKGDLIVYPSYGKVVAATDKFAVVEFEGKYGVISY